MRVRAACLADVPEIVRIDDSRYSGVSSTYADDLSEMFARRIENSPGWFWVAEAGGRLEGLLSCVPTRTGPQDFVSWNESTAEGTLDGRFAESSDVLYVVALTTTPAGSELAVTDLLAATALAKAIRTGKRLAYFCGRLPGYSAVAHRMSAEEYYEATTTVDGHEVALDPQVRHFESLGLRRLRLVEGGFVGDADSMDYGVLFEMNIPLQGWPLPRLWSGLIGLVARQPRVFALAARWA